MAEQTKEMRIGGSGERRVEQVAGDVHHVFLHQVLFCLPCWIEEYINVGWMDHWRICTSLLSSPWLLQSVGELVGPKDVFQCTKMTSQEPILCLQC